MDILDDMGVSELSAKVKKKKVNYSFKYKVNMTSKFTQINI